MHNLDTMCMTLTENNVCNRSVSVKGTCYLTISYLCKLLNIFGSDASFVNQRTWAGSCIRLLSASHFFQRFICNIESHLEIRSFLHKLVTGNNTKESHRYDVEKKPPNTGVPTARFPFCQVQEQAQLI